MAWVYLGVAGILEIVWAYSMKLSEGFTRPGPTVVTLVGTVASFWFLSLSMKVLPLGTAYVIWTGIGAVGAFVLGITILGESVDIMRLIAAALIVTGLLLMKLASPH
ncbi:quaternary ammonium compound-resistance protein SugE [Paracoccus halophilus]|uniref:Guanidinium exporter n=1 Tax=Paracoccus halophilus TaxID=376733 RepID=A0A099F168_9RHOB|nr:multidrug efflux SMR transporter [Paracoccus halophilus]KGJ03978.1 multidrug transporter [Paracoccus halophilus]SFA44717.1 quaternary ammonium compound-resistance protein SugE [Paracoccus halophilus]